MSWALCWQFSKSPGNMPNFHLNLHTSLLQSHTLWRFTHSRVLWHKGRNEIFLSPPLSLFLSFCIFTGTTGRKWNYLSSTTRNVLPSRCPPRSPCCNDIGKGNKFIYWMWYLMQAWVWSPTVCPESMRTKAKLTTLEWWETQAICHLQFRSHDIFGDFSWHSLLEKSWKVLTIQQ